jgi:MYXO-CTERM domain-containing protein
MGCAGVLLFMTLPALAVPFESWYTYQPDGQDLNPWATHELGDFFPPEELIVSSWQETTYRPCQINLDSPLIPNIEVTIANLTGRSWTNVQYVADPETSIQNYDLWRINDGLTFLIDRVGLNTPLIYESMIVDNVFQAGETWKFVIQDYVNALGGPATPFDSWDSINGVGRVGSQSGGFPPSTGSIVTPEPVTLTLLAVGGLALLRRRH